MLRLLLAVWIGALIGLGLHGCEARAATEDPANLSWARLYAANTPAVPHIRSTAVREAVGPADRHYARVRITNEAHRQGIPVELALAVATHESGLRCQVRGAAGELGPLQIKPATARMIGYRGATHDLNSCGAGVEWGLRHLALAYRRCGTYTGAARLHNRGLGSHCGSSRYTVAVAALIERSRGGRWARREWA